MGGQNSYLGISPPTLFAWTTVKHLGITAQFPEAGLAISEVSESLEISAVNRSVLTPNIIRRLLARYDRCIQPLYPITHPDLTSETDIPLKKLPNLPKFKILIACAIAAAQESYRNPDWRIIAKVTREWADELAVSIISVGDGESIVALLLLLVYELADPSRGMLWQLLAVATRLCLQLGWHRREPTIPLNINLLGAGNLSAQPFSELEKDQLVSVLKSIER